MVVLGWFVARIVQRVVTNLLAAVGTDALSEKAGLAKALGETKLSQALGLIVQILILVPVIIAALNALQLEAVTRPTSNMLDVVLGDALLALNQVDSALAVVLRGLDVERRRSDPSDAAMARLFWMLGRIRLAQGLRPAADSALDEALALERAVHGDGTTADLYDQAAYWSLRGDLRRSIALLSDAVTNGYDDPRIRYDRRLVPVRAEPEFNGLIGVVRERLQRDLGRAP